MIFAEKTPANPSFQVELRSLAQMVTTAVKISLKKQQQ